MTDIVNNKELTGLFFGSFNPLHNGHLAIARCLLEKGCCREIWFVISPQNPWKKDLALLPEQLRLEIVQAAVAGDSRMFACDIEFSMHRPSYTYLTLEALARHYPEKNFALIIGEDNFERFHLWKNYEEILARYPVFVYPRPGFEPPATTPEGVKLVSAPLWAVSSSEIRQKVREGKDISADVPPSVVNLVERYYRRDTGTPLDEKNGIKIE